VPWIFSNALSATPKTTLSGSNPASTAAKRNILCHIPPKFAKPTLIYVPKNCPKAILFPAETPEKLGFQVFSEQFFLECSLKNQRARFSV